MNNINDNSDNINNNDFEKNYKVIVGKKKETKLSDLTFNIKCK